MDTRQTITHGTWRLRTATIVAVALLMTQGVTSTTAASPTACRVQNTDTGKTFSAVQPAVDAAKPGDRLTVKGTCVGGTVIDKDLVIAGVRTRTTGSPTLSGAGTKSVLRIEAGTRVKIRDLVIRDGHARRPHEGFSVRRRGLLGGGIANRGTLTLRDVAVRDNVAEYGGGGVWNDGTLTLNGDSRISGNTSYFGGGVYVRAGKVTLNGRSRISGNTSRSPGESGGGVYTYWRSTLALNGSSSISGNSTPGFGGGVMNGIACPVTLNDDSSISGNESSAGGGIYNYGSLTLNDRSAVSGNQATQTGGGVVNQHRLTMNDDSIISTNAARGWGGGIVNAAGEIVDLRDRSSVAGNAAMSAGGIQNWGTVRMYGTSRVTGNTALGGAGDMPGGSLVPDGMGGGVFNSERLVLHGTSSIDGNTAHDGGGGVGYFASHGTNVGLRCGPGGNVHDNSPDDCLPWQ